MSELFSDIWLIRSMIGIATAHAHALANIKANEQTRIAQLRTHEYHQESAQLEFDIQRAKFESRLQSRKRQESPALPGR